MVLPTKDTLSDHTVGRFNWTHNSLEEPKQSLLFQYVNIDILTQAIDRLAAN